MMWWRSAAAVCRFELGVQRREPATVLYALVFLLLTFAFVSSGTVELVRNRGDLPKLSPLAIALALGGLTAFGQVITTMITASAMLRDRAWRTDQLLFTTPLSHSAWVVGRWLAALMTMTVVYSALMLGVWAGAFALFAVNGSLNGPGSVAPASVVSAGDVIVRTLWTWTTLTVPTTVAVATILVTAAVRTRHLLGVLAAALALLFLWQGCEAIVRHATDADNGLAVLASLADPFGTSALQVVTASWSDAERATRLVPVAGLVGASRVLWLLLALAVGSSALRPMPYVTVNKEQPLKRDAGSAGRVTWIVARPFFALVHFTLQWTWRERGWLVIATLGVLNVLAHMLTAAAGTVADAAGIVALVG